MEGDITFQTILEQIAIGQSLKSRNISTSVRILKQMFPRTTSTTQVTIISRLKHNFALSIDWDISFWGRQRIFVQLQPSDITFSKLILHLPLLTSSLTDSFDLDSSDISFLLYHHLLPRFADIRFLLYHKKLLQYSSYIRCLLHSILTSSFKHRFSLHHPWDDIKFSIDSSNIRAS